MHSAKHGSPTTPHPKVQRELATLTEVVVQVAGNGSEAVETPSGEQWTKVLGDFDKAETKTALLSFPIGRKLVKKATLKQGELEHMETCHAELRQVLAKPKVA